MYYETSNDRILVKTYNDSNSSANNVLEALIGALFPNQEGGLFSSSPTVEPFGWKIRGLSAN